MARAVAGRVLVAGSVLIVVACSTADPTSPSTQSPGPPPSVAPTLPVPTGDPTNAVPPTPPLSPNPASASPDPNAPPVLELIVDGQPHAGIVGSYTWGTYTQGAPWHPATGLQSISVSANGELTAELTGATRMDTWAARAADAADQFAETIRPLGSGAGTVAFFPPPAGDWVLELHVVYADGAGDGAYYWHLVVR
jgi:hypothetical protein